MSVAETARILKHSRQRGAAKLLLVVLADFANADGLCWPGISTLADAVNETERHTIRLLGKLNEAGEIATKPGGGRGHLTMYAVLSGLSDPERQARKRVLQNTVLKSTVTRNSDTTGQETVTSGAETVTSGAKPDKPVSPSQSVKPAQNDRGIHEGSVRIHDHGSGGEEIIEQSTPPTPPTPPAQAIEISPAEQALTAQYPRLKLSEAQRQALVETVKDLSLWARVLTIWRESGYKPNPGNLLDRYRKEAASEAHQPRRSGPPAQQEERPAGSGPPPGLRVISAEEIASWGLKKRIPPSDARAG